MKRLLGQAQSLVAFHLSLDTGQGWFLAAPRIHQAAGECLLYSCLPENRIGRTLTVDRVQERILTRIKQRRLAIGILAHHDQPLGQLPLLNPFLSFSEEGEERV